MNEMEINCTTVIFLEDGTRIIKHDQWASAQQVPEEAKGKQWKGFTFFKMKSMAKGQQAGIPEGDDEGTRSRTRGKSKWIHPQRGRDPLRPERKATESRTASLVEKTLVLGLNNPKR